MLKKIKKAQGGGGEYWKIFGWIIVAAIVLMALFWLYRMGALDWIKQLPGFQSNGGTGFSTPSSSSSGATSSSTSGSSTNPFKTYTESDYRVVIELVYTSGIINDYFWFWWDDAANKIKIGMAINGDTTLTLGGNWYDNPNDYARFKDKAGIDDFEKSQIEFVAAATSKEDMIKRAALVSEKTDFEISFAVIRDFFKSDYEKTFDELTETQVIGYLAFINKYQRYIYCQDETTKQCFTEK